MKLSRSPTGFSFLALARGASLLGLGAVFLLAPAAEARTSIRSHKPAVQNLADQRAARKPVPAPSTAATPQKYTPGSAQLRAISKPAVRDLQAKAVARQATQVSAPAASASKDRRTPYPAAKPATRWLQERRDR